jgi:hypothetical protein
MYCAAGTLFHPVLRQCMMESDVDCGASRNKPDLTTSSTAAPATPETHAPATPKEDCGKLVTQARRLCIGRMHTQISSCITFLFVFIYLFVLI